MGVNDKLVYKDEDFIELVKELGVYKLFGHYKYIYLIKKNNEDLFMGTKTGYDVRWVHSSKARVFSRRSDASSSLNCNNLNKTCCVIKCIVLVDPISGRK